MGDCENNHNHRAKVPFDPGWNDPPKLSYTGQQTTANRPRNFLNKRVAFPLSCTSTSTELPSVNMPPLTTAVVPPFAPSTQPLPMNIPQENISIDSVKLLKETKEILLDSLSNSSELGSKTNDIKRRIDVMEEMWLNGKLNNGIQIRMKGLACALRDDQPTAADEIHRALMVDHVSTVGTWMPGIKQLIHHCIAKSELLGLDKE